MRLYSDRQGRCYKEGKKKKRNSSIEVCVVLLWTIGLFKKKKKKNSNLCMSICNNLFAV